MYRYNDLMLEVLRQIVSILYKKCENTVEVKRITKNISDIFKAETAPEVYESLGDELTCERYI